MEEAVVVAQELDKNTVLELPVAASVVPATPMKKDEKGKEEEMKTKTPTAAGTLSPVVAGTRAPVPVAPAPAPPQPVVSVPVQFPVPRPTSAGAPITVPAPTPALPPSITATKNMGNLILESTSRLWILLTIANLEEYVNRTDGLTVCTLTSFFSARMMKNLGSLMMLLFCYYAMTTNSSLLQRTMPFSKFHRREWNTWARMPVEMTLRNYYRSILLLVPFH
jgi:hypothetical protein